MEGITIADYFIKINGIDVPVSIEVLKASEQMDRRYRYLKYKDALKGVILISPTDESDQSSIVNLPDPNVNIEESIIAKIMGERIKECLLQLSENDRMFMWMHFFEGKSVAALAKQMGIPRTTLMNRKYAALRKLKKLFENQ